MSKHRWLSKVLRPLERYARSWWYPGLVAVAAAADAYVFMVPIEVLLIPAVLAHRQRWFLTSFWVTLGSAVGAASFAYLTSVYGNEFLTKLMPSLLHDKAWRDSEQFLRAHGWWGLSLVSLSPFPQHAAVAVAGLAKMNLAVVFLAVFAGRFIKYEILGWAAAYSPKLLSKLGILPPRKAHDGLKARRSPDTSKPRSRRHNRHRAP